MNECKFYTIKRPLDYLHKGIIVASPMFFWTTRQNNTVAHAPKENMIGIKIYIGDNRLRIVKCPCIGDGKLPLSISKKQFDLPLSSNASRIAEEI